ncbi:hypothetical protein F1559_000814 [Cyanidiococcus yangmingshanensis]|uniref:Uncharacterized protein n=1 Tax=Cyanidiococcus yangmingshanensis TaxID=2690220 RepID=A0A7J7IJD9_9RHOD|nr:hypothetical protein F1559_000814 [Cyanidiococcus yangmingshanensis]
MMETDSEGHIVRELLDLTGESGVIISGRALARSFSRKVQLKRPFAVQSATWRREKVAKRRKGLLLPDDLTSLLPCGQEINIEFVGSLKDRLDAWLGGYALSRGESHDENVSQRFSTPPCIALEDIDIFMDSALVLYVCRNCRRPVIESRVYEHILRCCPERWIVHLNECAKQITNVAGQLGRMLIDSEQHSLLISMEFPEFYFSQLVEEEDGTGKARFGRHAKRLGRLCDAKLLFLHGMQSAKASIADHTSESPCVATDLDMGLYRGGRAYFSSRAGKSSNYVEVGSKNHLNNIFTEPTRCRTFHRKYFWPRFPPTPSLLGTEGEVHPDRLDPLGRLLYMNMSWERLVQVVLPPIMKRRSTHTKNQAQTIKEHLSTREELSPASNNTIAHALLRVQNKRPAGASWLIDLRQLPQSKFGSGVFHGQSFFPQPGTFWTDPRRGMLSNNAQATPSSQKSSDGAEAWNLTPRRAGSNHLPAALPRRDSGTPALTSMAPGERSRMAALSRTGSADPLLQIGQQQEISSPQEIERQNNLASTQMQDSQRNLARLGSASNASNPHREPNQEGSRQLIHRELVEWLQKDPFFLQMLDAARERVFALSNLTQDRRQQALETLERRLMFERLRAIAQAVIFAREMPKNSRARISAASLLSTLRPMNDAQRKALGEFVRQLMATQRSTGQGPRRVEQGNEPAQTSQPRQNTQSAGSLSTRAQSQGIEFPRQQRNQVKAEPRENVKTEVGTTGVTSSEGMPNRQRSDVDLLAAIDRALGIRRDP